jgi:hypothetical protein
LGMLVAALTRHNAEHENEVASSLEVTADCDEDAPGIVDA